MLQWLSNLLDDPATVESRLLRQLLAQAPELPDWSCEVQKVLTRLLARNRIQRPMACRVLDMPAFNALALPHKTIVVSRSLVEFCRDERHQIAFVLAHEAAHIHLGHAWDRSRANALVSLFRATNPLLGAGMRMLLDRAYSREQELEADDLAVSLSARAEYAPEAAISFLRRLAGLADTGSSVVSQLLSTHPPVKERIEQLTDTVRRWQIHGSG